MMWTLIQIGVSRSIGDKFDKFGDKLGYGLGAFAVNEVLGRPLEKVGHVLHFPERVMYSVATSVTETILGEIQTAATNVAKLQETLPAQLYEKLRSTKYGRLF